MNESLQHGNQDFSIDLKDTQLSLRTGSFKAGLLGILGIFVGATGCERKNNDTCSISFAGESTNETVSVTLVQGKLLDEILLAKKSGNFLPIIKVLAGQEPTLYDLYLEQEGYASALLHTQLYERAGDEPPPPSLIKQLQRESPIPFVPKELVLERMAARMTMLPRIEQGVFICSYSDLNRAAGIEVTEKMREFLDQSGFGRTQIQIPLSIIIEAAEESYSHKELGENMQAARIREEMLEAMRTTNATQEVQRLDLDSLSLGLSLHEGKMWMDIGYVCNNITTGALEKLSERLVKLSGQELDHFAFRSSQEWFDIFQTINDEGQRFEHAHEVVVKFRMKEDKESAATVTSFLKCLGKKIITGPKGTFKCAFKIDIFEVSEIGHEEFGEMVGSEKNIEKGVARKGCLDSITEAIEREQERRRLDPSTAGLLFDSPKVMKSNNNGSSDSQNDSRSGNSNREGDKGSLRSDRENTDKNPGPSKEAPNKSTDRQKGDRGNKGDRKTSEPKEKIDKGSEKIRIA